MAKDLHKLERWRNLRQHIWNAFCTGPTKGFGSFITQSFLKKLTQERGSRGNLGLSLPPSSDGPNKDGCCEFSSGTSSSSSPSPSSV